MKWLRQIRIQYVSIIVLTVISFIPLGALFNSGLPVTHDGQDHVARVANFIASFEEGNLVPRWGHNLNWGYGHPVLQFLYPLPSYAASLWHSLGLSYTASVKAVFISSYIVSVLFMYMWARKEFSPLSGIVTAVLYGYAPYRFVDLYVRGALGEHVAFIFLPLSLYAVLLATGKESKRKWGYAIFAIAIAGLLLSHNAISIMMLPFLAWYVLYKTIPLRIEIRKPIVTQLVLFGALGFLLSSFFWIPALMEGKYTLRDIVTQKEYDARYVALADFIDFDWSYGGSSELSKHLGFSHIGIVITAIWFALKTKRKTYIWWLLGWLTIYLLIMTKYSDIIWDSVEILQKFQFPWRFLTMTTLVSSMIGGWVIHHLSKRVAVITSIVVVGICLISTRHMWQPSAYKEYKDDFFDRVYYGTTDTGESSPIWSVRFMEREPVAPMKVIDGRATITLGERTTTTRSYTVDAVVDSRLVENTLFFPGWRLYIDGQLTETQYHDPDHRGLMTFHLTQGQHDIRFRFFDTKLRRFSNWLSVFGVLLLSAYIIFSTGKRHRT